MATPAALKDLNAAQFVVAVSFAVPHVYRQQHVGAHAQDRWDAMVWLNLYTESGRCTCAKCNSTHKGGNPGKRSASKPTD